jgi:hypothetical protein
MSRLTEVSSKFADHYVCKLAVLDHMQEVIEVHRQWQAVKAVSPKDAEVLLSQFNKGLADCLLLLEELVPAAAAEQRLLKFAANADSKAAE